MTTNYLLQRLVQGVISLLLVIMIALALTHLSGDPTLYFLPPEATEEQRATFRHKLHLDDPFFIQYIYYVTQLAQGDFGKSLTHDEPSLQVFLRHLPATLELTTAAMFLAVITAVPAGILAGVKRHSVYDHLGTIAVLFGQSIATFWLGMMLILLFSVRLGWLPVSGRGGLAHLVLPSITLSVWIASLIMRLTRSSVIEAITQDYVRVARAKGLSEQTVVFRHVLRNALLPIVTIVALQFGALMGGALLTETVFAWPGVGMLLISSVETRDFPVVITIITVVAAGLIAINFLVDVFYTRIDPRIRLG